MAKTRLASSTKLANYLGAGKDFDPSEVPTLRDVLRKGIYFDTSPIPVAQLSLELHKFL